jgi:hypothetical protein
MIETVAVEGMSPLAAEQAVMVALEDETDAEREERLRAEAAAERRRQYEQQQAFIRASPRLPGMGARVISGKRA